MAKGEAVVTIEAAAPTGPEVARLIALSDAYAAALYPPASNHGASIDELRSPGVRFFLARTNGHAVGCGGFARHADGWGEVKRLFVREDVRDLKVGVAAPRGDRGGGAGRWNSGFASGDGRFLP